MLMLVAMVCRITGPIFLALGLLLILVALVCKALVKWAKNLTEQRKTSLQRTFLSLIVIGPVITVMGFVQKIVGSLF